MTFDAKQEARIIVGETEFYAFDFGGGVVERYTTARRKVTAWDEEWTPAPILRGNHTTKQTLEAGQMRLTMPCIPAFVSLIAQAGLDTISVTISRGFGTDYANDYANPWWQGYLADITVTPTAVAGNLRSIESLMKSVGPGVLHQAGCNQTLYDQSEYGCGVDPSGYIEQRTVTAIAEGGRLVTVDGTAPADVGYFVGGRISKGSGPYRWISQHAGLDLVLHIPVIGLEVGDTVNLLPGCDKTIDTCVARFGNRAGFLGFPLIPVSHPVVDGF